MKRLLATLLSLLMLFSLAACGSNAAQNSATSAPAAASTENTTPADTATDTTAELSGDPIYIGVLASLTGEKANYGQCEKNAALLAEADINAAGGVLGRPVKVVCGDYRANAQECVNAVRQLIDQYHCTVITGPANSGPAIASASLCDEAKVPMITTFATNVKVTMDDDGNTRPYIFRICYTDPHQGKVLAQYSYNVLNAKKAVILYDVGSDYAAGINENFEAAYLKAGGEIVAKLGFKTGDLDFRSQLSEVMDKEFDMIFVPNTYKEIALIANQMADLGMTGKQIVAGDTAMSALIVEMAGENVENMVALGHFSFSDPKIAAFIERYMKEYNTTTTPEQNAVLAYDSVMLAADAINRAGTTDGETVKAAIENTVDFEMLHCTFTMDPETHNAYNKPAAVYMVKDGKHTFIENYKPTD